MNTHTKTRSAALASAALLFASWAWPAQADNRLEERRPLAANGSLSVHNVAGDILVRGWDREEMHLTARTGRSFERLEITGDRDSLKVRVRVRDGEDNVDETELTLQVPVAVALAINAVSGDIEAAGLSGPIDIQTVSGDIGFAGESTKVRMHTVSGDVELSAPSADTDLTSVSGDIQARRLRGQLIAESVSGNVDAEVRDATRVEGQSVSGDIIFVLGLTPDAKVSAQTLSGDVTVKLPLDASFTAAMKTFSGDLGTRGFDKPPRGETRFRLTAGRGQADIDLNSFSGDVEVIGD